MKEQNTYKHVVGTSGAITFIQDREKKGEDDVISKIKIAKQNNEIINGVREGVPIDKIAGNMEGIEILNAEERIEKPKEIRNGSFYNDLVNKKENEEEKER